MYVLYGGRFTRALLVEQVLLESDLPYELREVDIINNQHRSSEYLKINPAGWVPALITPEGTILYETPAINLYLADHHQVSHLAPAVTDKQRGLFLSRLFYLHDELEPIMKRYFYPHRYVLRESDASHMKKHALKQALTSIGVIEKLLCSSGPYHLGERFSLADMVLSYWTVLIEYLGVLQPYPAVQQCLNLVRQRTKLRVKFDEQADWRQTYTEMQARGEGVK